MLFTPISRANPAQNGTQLALQRRASAALTIVQAALLQHSGFIIALVLSKTGLSFEASTNVARPFKVYWQVTNTGNEAEWARNLRGGFYDGTISRGGLERQESTKYAGSHCVQCFIVKDGNCVAMSDLFVVNIAQAADSTVPGQTRDVGCF
jgi:hypothetical protein